MASLQRCASLLFAPRLHAMCANAAAAATGQQLNGVLSYSTQQPAGDEDTTDFGEERKCCKLMCGCAYALAPS
jgi:hypothetical protein